MTSSGLIVLTSLEPLNFQFYGVVLDYLDPLICQLILKVSNNPDQLIFNKIQTINDHFDP